MPATLGFCSDFNYIISSCMGHLPALKTITQEFLTPFHSDFAIESDIFGSVPKIFSLLSTEILRLENSSKFLGNGYGMGRNLGTKKN